MLFYLRITINGKRIKPSINRSIERSKWSGARSHDRGTTSEVRLLNIHLDTLTNKVHAYEREMILDGKEITYQSFKEKWFGIGEEKQMIIKVFAQHNQDVETLLGKDFAACTLERYETSLSHTRSFMEWMYKVSDMEVTKIDYAYISTYAFWLKSVRECNHNTTMKYLGNFKKIILICLKHGWITKDPFVGFKLTKHEVKKPILTDQELERIIAKKYDNERLNFVKDIFIFSCYTGLAYADVKKIKTIRNYNWGRWITVDFDRKTKDR